MQRRDFLKHLGGGATLAAMPGIVDATSRREKPNIFMIFSDDLTKRDLGFYGNEIVRTPRIDRFAAEGMRFDNMFTPCPMCAPSRSSLFTGLYPVRHGAHPNWSELKPGIKTLPHYMSRLGYRVILLGKKHIKPEESYPFEFYDDDMSALGPGADLKRILADPGDKPLCIIMVKFHAHYGWFHNKHNYDPEAVDLPPYLVDTPETRQLRANYYSYIEDVDIAVGRVLDLLEERGMKDNTLTIWTADHGTQWPHERQNIYDAALHCPFIARWPGHIPPGSATDALVDYVDILPTFIEAAGGEVDAVIEEGGGQTFDGRSFLGLLHEENGEHHVAVFGCVTWGVIEAYPMRSVRTKTHKYIRNIDSHFRFPTVWALDMPRHEMMNTVWKSWEAKAKTDPFAAERVRAELFRPPEELYDIRRDPHELHNLAEDPDHADVLDEMRERLEVWMRQQGDAGDSAYHKDAGKQSFLDEVYCRRRVVNVKMMPLGAAGGMHDKVRVELTSPVWTARIHYTLDGTEPTEVSSLYRGPFELDPPATIKARGFWDSGSTPVQVTEFTGVDFRFLYEQTHLKPLFWP